MPVVGSWEGTHAKGSCEPGQAGRCSHKQRPLVQWISLSQQPAVGTFFSCPRAPLRIRLRQTNSRACNRKCYARMAKRKPSPGASESPSRSAAGKNLSSRQESDSTYTVLARRYRPQQFAELVGQEPVVQALVNALESNRVAHAYLFTGARGVGKTSTARILAKALNCLKGPTGLPCGDCELCLAIASGDDIDVLEIDGASNRGIDEVRAIR